MWGEQGRRRDAHQLLAPVYDWFIEGLDTADLKDARVVGERFAISSECCNAAWASLRLFCASQILAVEAIKLHANGGNRRTAVARGRSAHCRLSDRTVDPAGQ